MIITPLSLIQVNWPQLLNTVKEVEGRDLGRNLDIQHIKIGEPVAYLKTLEQFAAYLPSEPKVKSFLRFAFLTDFLNLDGYDLNLLKSKYLTIAEGSLLQWELAINSGSTRLQSPETLEFFNGVLQIFETYGFRSIWNARRKSDLGNGLFILEGAK